MILGVERTDLAALGSVSVVDNWSFLFAATEFNGGDNMLHVQFTTNLNRETADFVRWLLATGEIDVDELIDEAHTCITGKSRWDGGETDTAVRDEVANRLWAIPMAEMTEIDGPNDTMYSWPHTKGHLRRNLLVQAYQRIDCKAAANELLILAGLWQLEEAAGQQ
jgi:hypothetical protein